MTGPREPLPTRVEATQDLPRAYDDVLRRGLGELGLTLAEPARAAIDGHLRLLLAWTGAINLTAVRDPVAAATLHVLDSLSAVPLLRDLGVVRFVDLGSGGGLPGIPVAAALPARSAVLVESTAKKARFLEAAVAATGLAGSVTVQAIRAESLAGEPAARGRWPAVTARAVASLADLVELAFPLLEPGGRLVAWKRGELATELAAAARAAEALGGGTIEDRPVTVTGLAGHRLIVVRRTGDVPPDYPREPAARRRGPW